MPSTVSASAAVPPPADDGARPLCTACDGCRKSKLKCDGGKPCANCVKRHMKLKAKKSLKRSRAGETTTTTTGDSNDDDGDDDDDDEVHCTYSVAKKRGPVPKQSVTHLKPGVPFEVSLHRSTTPGVPGFGLTVTEATNPSDVHRVAGGKRKCLVRKIDPRVLTALTDTWNRTSLWNLIRLGDVILGVNGIDATTLTFDQIAAAMRSTPPDCALKLRLVRPPRGVSQEAKQQRSASSAAETGETDDLSASASLWKGMYDETIAELRAERATSLQLKARIDSIVAKGGNTEEENGDDSGGGNDDNKEESEPTEGTASFWKTNHDAVLSAFHTSHDETVRLRSKMYATNRQKEGLLDALKATKTALDALCGHGRSGDDGAGASAELQEAQAPSSIVGMTLFQVEEEVQRQRLRLRELESAAEALRSTEVAATVPETVVAAATVTVATTTDAIGEGEEQEKEEEEQQQEEAGKEEEEDGNAEGETNGPAGGGLEDAKVDEHSDAKTSLRRRSKRLKLGPSGEDSASKWL